MSALEFAMANEVLELRLSHALTEIGLPDVPVLNSFRSIDSELLKELMQITEEEWLRVAKTYSVDGVTIDLDNL